jgi:limonene-1,2-epoxide hydrolase
MRSNLELVLAFVDSWASRDLDRILAAMDANCFYHNIPWEPLTGHAAIRESLEGFVGGSDAIDWVVLHAAETSDGVVMTERLDRFRMAGKWIEMPVMGVFELVDDKIMRWRDYFDSAQFQAQMAIVQAG